MPLSPDRQRERLKGLMLVRVVIVTAFLGSALAIDAEGFAGFSDPKNATLVGLIVGTYLLTIFHAFGLRRDIPTQPLAYFQIGGDLLITTLLILVTGGFDSIYLFFFHLTIINAAIVADSRGTFLAAGTTAAAMSYFAAITIGWLPHPILDLELGHVGPIGLIYEVAVNSLAGLLIAVLAAYLSQRLGEATVELEQSKTDIRDLRALNRNILSSLSSGLLTVDDQGTIIFFNRAAEEITGYTAAQVLDNSLSSLFPNLASASSTQKINIAGDPRLESSFQRPDGTTIYLGFSTSPLRDGTGEKVGKIIIFQDLSEIRKLEAQIKRSEKLAAIGQLSASIAHEIRNPLASISGSVEMLRVDDETSDDNRILMNIVVREVERLDTLITDFLAYSQPRTLKPAPTDLLPLLEEILRLFRVQADRDQIQLHFDPSQIDHPLVLVDHESIRQVIWNLIKNAADALLAIPEERRQIRLDLQLSPDRQALTLSIEDDGPGIPEAHRDEIFEPFFTTKETGTGLGLATIYRLLEDQSAQIYLEDPESLQGARFEVLLPLATSPPENESSHSDALPAKSSSQKEALPS